MNKLKHFTGQFLNKVQKDKVILLGAAQAYYYLLSIVPLVVVCFAIIPYLHIDPDKAVNFLKDALPGELASFFEKDIMKFVNSPRGGLLTIGIMGALWSVSNAIHALIKSVNEAYGVKETRSFIFVRLIALGLTMGMIITILFAMVLPVFGNTIFDYLKTYIGFSSTFEGIYQILLWISGLVLLILFLIILYRFAPNLKIPMKHVLPGALTACILWLMTSFGFFFYVSNFGSYSAIYGSLGGLVILMLWFFLTGIILMIGAILNVLYHENKIR